RAVPPREPGIAPAAAAGVEHPFPFQVARVDPRLDPEHRAVFLVAGHIIAVPLPAEAGDVGIGLAREPGDPAHDRIGCWAATVVAAQLRGVTFAGAIEHPLTTGTTDDRQQLGVHARWVISTLALSGLTTRPFQDILGARSCHGEGCPFVAGR